MIEKHLSKPNEDLLTVEELANALRVKPIWVYSKSRMRCPGSIPMIIVGKYTFPQMSPNVLNLFEEGTRDETLFHLANCLVKGGMGQDMMLNILLFLASKCDPPFPEKEALIKIESALSRKRTHEKNLAQDVRDFVMSSNGLFMSSEIHSCLNLSSRQEKKNVSNILGRFVEEGVIERAGNRNGQFRRIDKEVEEMDFLNAETESVNLWLPFGIHNMVETMPGNIILIAGEPRITPWLKRCVNRHVRSKEDLRNVALLRQVGFSPFQKKMANSFYGITTPEATFKTRDI